MTYEKTFLLSVAVFVCSFVELSSADQQRLELTRKYEHAPDVRLVPSASVSDADVEAKLGDNAVVKLENLTKLAIPATSVDDETAEGEMVIRDNHGNYGTTDKTIIVSVNQKDDLQRLANDYGVVLVEVFYDPKVGLMAVGDTADVFVILQALSADDRVSFAELNTNFYDVFPN